MTAATGSWALPVPRTDRDVPDGRWPARWMRAVALRAAEQVPGARLDYGPM